MKKRNRITVCLVAGVLILAVSAGAAFGSVSGYSTYKEAVKALALKTDNVTMQGSMKATLDGKEFVSMTGEMAIDGNSAAKRKSGMTPSSATLRPGSTPTASTTTSTPMTTTRRQRTATT